MKVGVWARRAAGCATGVIAVLSAASPAAAAEAPGPAFVDQLGSQLQPLRDAGPGDVADARGAGVTIAQGQVLVDVIVDGDPDAASDRLEALGMTVAATTGEPRPTVEGSLPIDSIGAVTRAGISEAVLPVMGYGIDEADVGAETAEGVTRHNLPAAIAAAGTSGAGVEVGVISDSINQVSGGVAASQATGDLPANVTVLLDDTEFPSDEGRAMAEIIYDEAPGIDRILFSSGTLGSVLKAASIENLVANGADLIADDIFYLSEPFFQEGVIAQAVDRAKAAGIPYLASAGNRGRQSYESTFRDGGGGLHDFDPGAGVDTRNCLSPAIASTSPDRFVQIALGWDEPVGGVTTDLDLRITNPGGTVLASGTTANIATGDPKEIATYQNNTASPVQVCVEITRAAGSRAPFLKWIEHDNTTTPVPEINTGSDTINPDAASAQGSLAVAAVNEADAGLNTPETFSSRGPKTRFFDVAGNRLATPLVLAKPQLAAADGVATSVPDFEEFFGTSAAVPSAAGIVAILRSINPGATVNEVYAQMTDPANAIPCNSANPIQDCGAGFILADRAVAGLDRTPVTPRAQTKPGKADGKGGWFTKKKVTVSWDTTDPESPTETGCADATVTKEGTAALACDAVSGGGPGHGEVKIKHDSKKPKKPKVKGIENGETYKASQLPSGKKVKKCKSKDKTSGLKSCKVKGFSDSPGKHKLKATATDKAGLKSKKTVSYTVK